MKKILLFISLLPSVALFAQGGSEIYLFDIKEKKGEWSLSNGKNITNHKGYDNQPSFHPDEPVIYYTSIPEGEDGRADIKSYNYKTGITTVITSTPEREYSPTVTPDKKFLSCIIQRDNNAQDLGMYPIRGGEPRVLINDLIVGYHVWVNAEQLMLFVLGEPHTLQLYNVKTKEHNVVDENIGRSLLKIPGEEAISYISKKNKEQWVINKVEPASGAIAQIEKAVAGGEDLCWTPDKKLLMSADNKIYFIDPAKEDVWREVIVSTPFTTKVSRLALSKDGKKLAVVVME